MKHLKKITIITLIVLIILMSTLFFIKSVYGYHEDWDRVIDGNATNENTPTKQLVVGDEVYLTYSNKGKTYQDVSGNEHVSALNQPNIWCCQAGKELNQGTFKVTYKGDITDPILAYIISSGPNMTDGLQDEYTNDAQIALWYYIYDYKNGKMPETADLKRMVGDIGVNDCKYPDELTHLDGKDLTNAHTLYRAAQNYKFHTHTGTDIEITDLTCNEDTVTFKIKGYVEGDQLKINVGSTEIKDYNYNSATNEFSFKKTATMDSQLSVNYTCESCTAHYMVLKCAGEQRLIVAHGEKEQISNETLVKDMNTDVSLQKYITHVNGDELTEYTTITNRINKMADKDRADKIKKEISTDNTADDKVYKKENTVKIEPGDIVKYRIEVYNNSTVNATDIIVKDQIPEGSEIQSIKEKDKTIEFTSSDETRTFKWNTSLNAGDSTYFDVEIKFNEYSYEILTNKAWINETTPQNDTEYRIEDEDYVEMKKYSVSLEKYVSKVNDEDIVSVEKYDLNGDGKVDKKDYDEFAKYVNFEAEPSKDVDLNGDGAIDAFDLEIFAMVYRGRGYYPIWDDKTNEKKSNPVEVEVGDTITYTIELRNTDSNNDGTSIWVTDIEDVFDGNDKADLTYIEGSATGYGKNVKVDNSEKGELKITIDEPDEIKSGESAYLTLQFKVEVDKENTATEQILENTAKVTKITNKNNIEVDDFDGTNNNTDSDWVETQTYSVKLEKYVSKVDETNVEPTRENKAEHNDDNVSSTRNDYKYMYPVQVEKGNKVTYTIKVTNEGDTTAIITNIADYFPNGVKYNGTEYKGDVYCTGSDENNGKTENRVDFSEEITLEAGESKSFDVVVEVIESDMSTKIMKNIAEITSLKNKNNCDVKDTTENNNKDADYIQMDAEPTKEEKIDYTVEKIWEISGGTEPAEIKVKLYYIKDGEEIDYGTDSVTLSDSDTLKYTWKELPKNDSDGNLIKYVAREIGEDGNIVKKGKNYSDSVTTTYKDLDTKTTITNTGTTPSTPPDDPDKPAKTTYSVTKTWSGDDDSGSRPSSIDVALFKGEEKIDKITLNKYGWSHTWTNLDKYDSKGNIISYTVREYAKDGSILYNSGNKYDENYTVGYIDKSTETTITNAKTSETPSSGMSISGFVWNDMALNKNEGVCDGIKNEEESYLSGITVELYRDGRDKAVATTITNVNGEYCFTDSDLDTTLPENERYIKGPKVSGTERWEGSYYTYKVVFKYDGLKYTATNCEGYTSENSLASNADEDPDERSKFNAKFASVDGEYVYDKDGNKTGKLEYSTVNEEGYIPQSIYKYDNTWMEMKSYVNDIDLESLAVSEKIEGLDTVDWSQCLKHINLGLKGRDIFDLELTSDVYSTKVTVNNVAGTYKYNSNKVTVRRDDLSSSYNYKEDTANTYNQASKYEGESYDQNVRSSDIENSVYGKTGLEIKVTYKITVTNASNTAGKATKITDYYDNKYEFVGAYSDSNCEKSKKLETNEAGSGAGYKSIEIITPGTTLNQSDKMDIYVLFELNDPETLLKNLASGEKLATYNMAEITAYETKNSGNEATRGLLDKDSAPGSVATEKVRLTPNLIGTQTTIEYYFAGKDLNMLKYEDDTYATPTLYFVKDDSERKIIGTVFEDETTTDKTTKIKTGNGKLDEGEVGVYGATVQLIEQVEGGKERYKTTTGADGTFEFSGFLPGNYIIKYQYGDTNNTVLLNQSSEGINGKSYNGEDFQATNNGLNASEDNKPAQSLNTTKNYWYLYNESEGISTATDNESRRIDVSNNVANFTDDQMTVLNNMKAGKTEDACKSGGVTVSKIINNTKMNATTQTLFFNVEKTELNESGNTQVKTSFGDYLVSNMNFGIAEIPVTKIDLQKTIKEFTITDSVGQNVIAKLEFNDKGEAVTKGNVMSAEYVGGNYWAQIEDEKLQGARLEITFNIKEIITNEINFDGNYSEIAHITGLVDFISNNLSYNKNLGYNDKYWELTTINDVKDEFEKMIIAGETAPEGTVDKDGNTYNVIVKATPINPLLTTVEGTVEVPITLEKVLTSTETIEGIVTEVSDATVYSNIIEITGFEYQTTEIETTDGGTKSVALRDRIRMTKVIDEKGTTTDFIILPGKQYDSASSEELIITPPTGDSSISIIYYIIAVINLAVLAVGVFGIKKYVIKK